MAANRPKGFKYGDHPIGFSGRSLKLGRPRRQFYNNGAGQTSKKWWWEQDGRKTNPPKRGWTRVFR